ncbi:hypothetical protein J1N10_00375 [Carboxylicivirga sp. A043]|uniref:MnhB domain-containing protein n=1 Tax=Carboxylicivirga litoralis TaxID=2816963 RepID=UPI0021CB8830|nr:MnhB domain-containing protein [Carboxylicivirga sp. A043]MCU4154415.1 hypothetical protein [Carboxylicivirga sp. A043]
MAARVIRLIMVVASLIVLFRGHNLPGGGFIGGLLAGGGIVIYVMAFYSHPLLAKTIRYVAPLRVIGLILALGSGLIGIVAGQSFLHAQWFELDIPMMGSLAVNTPLIFDVGVYLTVIGVMVMMILLLMEDRRWS